MTIVHVLATANINEELHRLARPLYLIAHTAAYGTQTETELNHVDRIHKDTHDCEWQLSTDGKLARCSDRFTDYIKHPDYPTTDKTLLTYDDDKEGDDLNPAYYYNLATATALGANSARTYISRAEAEVEGFFPEEI